jgi:PqqD family protein of HPr-rel-A system
MNQQYANLALSESGFLFDALTGHTYTFNQTGKVILQGLIQGLTPEQIATALQERFEVTAQMAQKDVQQFIHQLKEINLVAKS